jgi:hypothetical protein
MLKIGNRYLYNIKDCENISMFQKIRFIINTIFQYFIVNVSIHLRKILNPQVPNNIPFYVMTYPNLWSLRSQPFGKPVSRLMTPLSHTNLHLTNDLIQ